MGHDTMTRAPRVTDTFCSLAIGAVLVAGGYAAWLIIHSGLRPKSERQNSADGFLWCNAAADQAHSNCATGPTNDQLSEETFF